MTVQQTFSDNLIVNFNYYGGFLPLTEVSLETFESKSFGSIRAADRVIWSAISTLDREPHLKLGRLIGLHEAAILKELPSKKLISHRHIAFIHHHLKIEIKKLIPS